MCPRLHDKENTFPDPATCIFYTYQFSLLHALVAQTFHLSTVGLPNLTFPAFGHLASTRTLTTAVRIPTRRNIHVEAHEIFRLDVIRIQLHEA